MSLNKHRLLFSVLALLLMHTFGYAQTWDTPISAINPVLGTGGLVGQHSKLAIINGNPAMVCLDNSHTNVYYVRATDAGGTTWGTPVEITSNSNSIGQYSNLVTANGNPAIAYYDATNGDLYYVRANDANGTTWGTPIAVATTNNVGQYASMVIVNGNPAIAYYDSNNGDLYYVRANDANGTTWGTPVAVATTNSVGQYASLAVINGNPAISYYDASNGDLDYVRATDANGTTWGTPVAVVTANTVGLYASLCTVNGNPAISYYNQTNTDLYYVRATDADGTTWGSPVAAHISTSNVGQHSNLTVVNGNPAIAYFDASNADLYYVRATNADGSTWGTPLAIATTNVVGQYANMIMVNGNPAITCYDASNGNLNYVRATDASGTTWGTIQSFDITGTTGQYSSMKLVNGNPAIAYYDGSNTDLYYVRATDASGTTWGTPVAVHISTGNVGQWISLCIVNGNPAISYYDAPNGDLYYVRATDANGTSWGTPVAVYTTGNVGLTNSMAVINGNPAIAYYDFSNSDLYYVRATDANGATWGSPVAVHTSTGNVGQYTSLCAINGNPAISYIDATNGDLYYARATDASGTSWGTPLAVVTTNIVGAYSSLCVVNGNPAIAYFDATNTDPYYVRATDANGTSWGTPVAVITSSASLGSWNSLCIINGNPAISCYDGSNSDLYYIRATDANGATWGTPVVVDATASSGPTSLISNNTDVYIAYYDQKILPNFIHGSTFSWTGGAGTTDWFTTGNWSTGTLPTNADNIAIPTGLSFYPNITTGTATCRNITINTGASVTVSGGTLQIGGNITNNGTFTNTSGTIELNGTQAQTIAAGTLNITNLTLNNSTGATIASGAVNILGTYTPTSGTLTTGGFFTVKSSATGTGRIAAGSTSGGYISGAVNTERYVPGRRAFRFLSHPFTTAQSMSVLTDDIDITGSGGSPFTATGTNNPSAFYFDVTTGDNSTTGNNPGWTAFTASSTWAQYQAMRVLVRGAKGEGLGMGSYTPSNNTLDMSGTVNQGDQNISLTKGSGTSFVLVGNPFASQVNMDAVSGTNIGSSFYIWDANQGTRGAYTSYTFGSSSFNLPAGGAFATTLSANGSILFEEADKTSGTAGAVFKTTGIANQVELKLEDSTIFWDRLLLNFDDNAMATVDYPDAAKLYNPDMTFYTLSKDDSMLSIDTRPYVANETIKLGLYAGLKKNFKFTAPNVNMPAGTKLYFTDKLLSKTVEVTPAFEYWFTVDANNASWGNSRFELNTQGVPTNGIANINASSLKVKLVPNPTTANVTLYYEGAGKELSIVVTNMMGVKVATAKAENANGNIVLPTAQLASGIYNITICNGTEVMTQKLIKQ